jgi:hypothetical protein
MHGVDHEVIGRERFRWVGRSRIEGPLWSRFYLEKNKNLKLLKIIIVSCISFQILCALDRLGGQFEKQHVWKKKLTS